MTATVHVVRTVYVRAWQHDKQRYIRRSVGQSASFVIVLSHSFYKSQGTFHLECTWNLTVAQKYINAFFEIPFREI